MEFSKQLMKEMLGAYLETTFPMILSSLNKDAIRATEPFIAQDFISIREATKRYNLCRKTLYNYHNKEYITLYSSEGKTFVSIRELENHIKKNPLPRNSGLKCEHKMQ